eukprot:gene11183-13021_t
MERQESGQRLCMKEGSELSCTAKSFEDTSFAAGSYVPFADKIILVGAKHSIYSSISIVDGLSGAVHSYVYSTRAPTAAPSVTPTLAGTGPKEQQRYQLYRWCIYKVRKVKEDKKRVKEMVAQDLPGKSRYPLFSAAAGLCCTIDMEDLEDSKSVNKAAVAVPSLAFDGQGAFVDSSGHFVDLESNVHIKNVGEDGDSNSAERKGNPKMEGKKEEILKSDPLEPLTSIAIVNTGTEERAITIINNNTHEKSCDVNDVSNASADEADSALLSSDAELERDVPGTSESRSESFYSAVDSEDYEPSDDSEVVYSISSNEEVPYSSKSDDANNMSDG